MTGIFLSIFVSFLDSSRLSRLGFLGVKVDFGFLVFNSSIISKKFGIYENEF